MDNDGVPLRNTKVTYMARDLEGITKAFWEVRLAVYHPEASKMSTEQALKRLGLSDKLRPEDWRLSALMHEVRFDIIEGNSGWREQQQEVGSVSTLRTKD